MVDVNQSIAHLRMFVRIADFLVLLLIIAHLKKGSKKVSLADLLFVLSSRQSSDTQGVKPVYT